MNAVLSPRFPTILEHEVQRKVAEYLPRVNAIDVMQEVRCDSDAQAAFDIALARNDARTLGQLFVAVRDHYARELALREMYDGDPPEGASLKAVCNGVFLRAAIAEKRRGMQVAAEVQTLRDELQLAVGEACNAYFDAGHFERVSQLHGIRLPVGETADSEGGEA